MSDEPNAVTTEVQDALDVHEPSLSKVPGSAPGEEDEGEESDEYDDDVEDEGNKDGEEYVEGEDDEEDDGEEGEDYEVAGKKSNLTALLLNDPNAVGGAGNADEGEYDVEADDDEDGEYADEPELDEEPEVVAVQANGNSKKRTIDDVNSEEVGVEIEERDATAKKVKA